MPMFKVRVREVIETPFSEVLIEAEDECEAEDKALGLVMRGGLGDSLTQHTTMHFGIDIRDA
jgi:hypothetical protein